jgi:hypothetical protein
MKLEGSIVQLDFLVHVISVNICSIKFALCLKVSSFCILMYIIKKYFADHIQCPIVINRTE